MDITRLLKLDWMKKFKLTIGRKQLAENNQSERDKVFNKFPDQRNDKRRRNTHSTNAGTLSGKTKS